MGRAFVFCGTALPESVLSQDGQVESIAVESPSPLTPKHPRLPTCEEVLSKHSLGGEDPQYVLYTGFGLVRGLSTLRQKQSSDGPRFIWRRTRR